MARGSGRHWPGALEVQQSTASLDAGNDREQYWSRAERAGTGLIVTSWANDLGRLRGA